MDILNNREWALVIWMAILGIYVAISPKMEEVRKSLKGVASAFFVKQIITVFVLMLAYMAGIIYYLYELGIWEFNQTKNTMIWCFSVGFLSLFKLESIKKDKSFFKHSVLDNLKLIAIIEFLIGVYTFNIIIEIVLVPVLAGALPVFNRPWGGTR